MTEFDKQEFSLLNTTVERAKYLLGCEITTKIQIIDMEPKLQAFISDIGLPVCSEGNEDEAQVIAKARTWLEGKANE